MNLLSHLHWHVGIAPVADFMAGTVNSDIMRCTGEGMLFLIAKGVGTTGTSTITVDACDNVTPSNHTAVAFMYRASTTLDVWGAWTQATATGFTTTAGSNQMYQVYVPASELGTEGYGYARLEAVEVAADPVTGCVLMAIVNPRHVEVPATMIT